MNKHRRLHRETRYTVRSIDGDSDIQTDAWNAVLYAVALAMEKLYLCGHLFVTVVDSTVVRTGDSDDDVGFAFYQQGMHHIVVCGGDAPDQLKGDRQQWIDQITLSTVHEVVHYWQDINGTINDDDIEDVAERMSREILGMESIDSASE